MSAGSLTCERPAYPSGDRYPNVPTIVSPPIVGFTVRFAPCIDMPMRVPPVSAKKRESPKSARRSMEPSAESSTLAGLMSPCTIFAP